MSEAAEKQDAAQAAAGRLTESLELLADMGRDFATSLDLEGTLHRALVRITDYLEASGGALFLLDEEGAILRCEACVGESEITGLTLKSDQGIVGRSVQTNTGAVIRKARDDPAFDSSVDALTGVTTRSILCAPLSVKDERIGAIELINKRSRDGLFDGADLRLLEILASSAALAILNARMATALVEQERMRRELELAAEIQRSLLPAPSAADFPVHGINIPARTVSGDFFDFFTLQDGRIVFCLGDVSGKGMNAALLMAKTASLFRCLGKTLHQPGELLARINSEICETATRGMFVTMVAGLYDPATGRVCLANAGHEPPLLHDGGRAFSELAAAAPPLGISPLVVGDGHFPEIEVELGAGTLYVFSDGVTEGRTASGDMLEAAGLKELIRKNATWPLADRLARLVRHVDRGGEKLHDDITLLAISREPGGAPGQTPSEADAMPSARPAGEAGERLMKLRVAAEARRLKEVRGAIGAAAEGAGCDAHTVHDVVIAVDEACQNIIRHAYGDGQIGDIIIEVTRRGDTLLFYLRDFARPVDTDKIGPRDLDDMRPGGLGTHFIRTVMDEVEFLRPSEGRGNLLRMKKSI